MKRRMDMKILATTALCAAALGLAACGQQGEEINQVNAAADVLTESDRTTNDLANATASELEMNEASDPAPSAPAPTVRKVPEAKIAVKPPTTQPRTPPKAEPKVEPQAPTSAPACAPEHRAAGHC